MNGQVVVVAHTKGGTGKTSLAFNLGYALAVTGLDVLVVDIDPQSGQSAFLGDSPALPYTAGDVLLGRCGLDDALVLGVHPRLDLLPADEQSIGDAVGELATDRGRASLAALLDEARSRWHVVVVDTPGHQSPALSAVLAAADGVLIPIPPEAGPVAELPTILNVVDAATGPDGRPEVFGVIRVRVWGNSVYRRVAEDQIRVIASEYEVPLLRHKVPEDAKFGEAHLLGMPVGAYAPRARSAVAFRFLAAELAERRGWPVTADTDPLSVHEEPS
jgi:chromosome partitioning protein